jgi:hypothetical protein
MGDHRFGSAKQYGYMNQRSGKDERPTQLGAQTAGGVLIEIADICPGPRSGDHCFSSGRWIAQSSRPLLLSQAILLLLRTFGIPIAALAEERARPWWRLVG